MNHTNLLKTLTHPILLKNNCCLEKINKQIKSQRICKLC
jgi:hypothetical protein